MTSRPFAGQPRYAGQAIRPNNIPPPTDATPWRPYPWQVEAASGWEHPETGGRGEATPYLGGHLGQHTVLTLPKTGGCDVIASLPRHLPSGATTRHLRTG